MEGTYVYCVFLRRRWSTLLSVVLLTAHVEHIMIELCVFLKKLPGTGTQRELQVKN